MLISLKGIPDFKSIFLRFPQALQYLLYRFSKYDLWNSEMKSRQPKALIFERAITFSLIWQPCFLRLPGYVPLEFPSTLLYLQPPLAFAHENLQCATAELQLWQ